MAGDWIKMRVDLLTHPKVVRISSALKADNLRTVGGLMAVWALFDAHSADGVLEGYTPEFVNASLRWDGFAEQMMRVGWMSWDGDETLTLPGFDAHNGNTAKRRAQDLDRKKAVRIGSGNLSASEADNLRTREEKRREEKKDQKKPPPVVVTLDSNLNGNDLLGPSNVKRTRTEAVPFQSIVDLYHEILCPPLPTCAKLTDSRKVHMRKRWVEDFDDLGHWSEYFEFVGKSPFLMGRTPPSNGRAPFRADIDFLINPSNVVKIIERKYHQ